MHIHIATAGKETDPIIKGFKGISGIDKAYLLYSEQYRESADEIVKYLDMANILVVLKPVDAFNFSNVMDQIIEIDRFEKKSGDRNRYSINVTGGTKIMGFAAYSSAYFLGATVYYVRATEEELPLEDQIMTILTTKTPKQSKTDKKSRAILNYILEETSVEKTVTSSQICEKFHFSKQNVAYYIRNLREEGLVEVVNGLEENGKINYSYNTLKLTQQGQMIAKFTRNN